MTMENNDEIRNDNTAPSETVFSNALKYGLYTAVAYILVSLLYYVLDISRESWLNYLVYLIIIAGIVMATINYRDKINGGNISFGKAFSTGVIISTVVGLIGAIYVYVFFNYIDPNAQKEMLEAVEQKLLEQGMSDEMIDQQVAMTQKFMKPAFMMISSLIGTVLIGSIISLITSAVLKKTDDSFNASFK